MGDQGITRQTSPTPTPITLHIQNQDKIEEKKVTLPAIHKEKEITGGGAAVDLQQLKMEDAVMQKKLFEKIYSHISVEMTMDL
mmetsp:Transcript_18450/g.13275  ORF Transcript_18450/g.13275 Transcript_18450/m.13275 type:complete len:83 (+) Transcript_18450:36-284(+)